MRKMIIGTALLLCSCTTTINVPPASEGQNVHINTTVGYTNNKKVIIDKNGDTNAGRRVLTNKKLREDDKVSNNKA